MPTNRYPSSDAVIHTDEEAYNLLPPYALARAEYQAQRARGDSPQQALKATLVLWRELRQIDRPTFATGRTRSEPG